MAPFYGRSPSASSEILAQNHVGQKIVNEKAVFADFDVQKSIKTGDPLGIYGKSQSILTPQGFEGCLISYDRSHFERIKDFALQRESGRILGFRSSVNTCGRCKIDKNIPRGLVYNERTEKGYFSNVQRCGSVWTCKVCAKKITEQRKQEIALAAKEWSQGICRVYSDFTIYSKNFVGAIRPSVEYIKGYVYMITLTNSHNASHSLESQREGQKKALNRFFGSRQGQELMKRLGKRWHITNYEVTLGENGWHPHHHILIFSDVDIAASVTRFFQLESELKQHWINCCRLSNLPLPNMEHGLNLIFAKTAEQVVSQYLCKWGVEHEMTKGHIKQGKQGGYTPFDLLRLSLDGDELLHGRKPSQWFKEYAKAFKGARQLMWSRGLKDLFGISDKSDDDIIEETLKDSEHNHDVPDLLFSLLVKYNKLAHYLNAFEHDIKNGTDYLKNLVNDIVNDEVVILQERVLQAGA